jgi:hypothetical protein
MAYRDYNALLGRYRSDVISNTERYESIRDSAFNARGHAMFLKLGLLALIGFVQGGGVLLSAQNSDQTPSPAIMQAVETAFPERLRFAPAPPKDLGTPIQPPYHSCAAVFRTAQNGTPDLVAVGYSGDGSEIAMLSYQESQVQIVDTSAVLEKRLMAEDCEVSVINLADPSEQNSPLANVIVASFSDGPFWFFLWDGDRLRNITALEPGSSLPAFDIPPRTAMYGSIVVDIDRSGPMQIIGPKEAGDRFPDDDGIAATGTLALFRFNGKIFAPTKTLLFYQQYEPNLPKTPDEQAEYKAGTSQWVSSIDMHQTPAPSYKLSIVNGDRDGSNRVSSAKIEINGVTIVSSTEINQSVENLTRTVHLQKQNALKVTVDGPANSHLYVAVE